VIPRVRGGGNRRHADVREGVNGLIYTLSTGCQWRAIPKGLPPRSTLYGYFDLWGWDETLELHEALYAKCRQAAAEQARPPRSSINGKKRHILVIRRAC
jgi:transposase